MSTPRERLAGRTEWRWTLTRIRATGYAYAEYTSIIDEADPPLDTTDLVMHGADAAAFLLSRPGLIEHPLPHWYDEDDEDKDDD